VHGNGGNGVDEPCRTGRNTSGATLLLPGIPCRTSEATGARPETLGSRPLRDTGQAGMTGVQGVSSTSLMGGIDLGGSVNRAGGAGRGDVVAGLLAAGDDRAAALPSATGESPPRPDRQWRSLPGLAERWKKYDPPSAVMGSGEDTPRSH
jgi:hypothetical protein